MLLHAIELHRIAIPLVRPFETSFGRETERELLLIRVRTDIGDGWGECVAMAAPLYSSEYVDAAAHVIERHLGPALLAAGPFTAVTVSSLLSHVVGHRMAKAALEAALLDAELRQWGVSFGEYFGAVRDRVECGVSVGISPDIPTLLDEVSGYVAEGYRRIKLKVKPGWDREPVAAVRDLIGAELGLQVDANTAYSRDDLDTLKALDEFGLLLIEQPFVEEDIASHVWLASKIQTPVCLDESITSTDVAIDAIERGATSIVNIKAGRVGGYLEAVRVHDACRERGIPVWCGGMLETGVGRAANVALAALPGFTLPGDTSGSSRYYAEDLTEPFELVDGHLVVPTGAGTGVTVREELVADWACASVVTIR
ncbi:o-succinylbenzoate synthase [Lysinibacter cavernae]|uniref:o-succinylbenzoate synthase n=1 Tax=Lysinibacter cavernae TaxID=1640652 RepID=A0A7X5TVH2_9MICO|nr:o-succinylbenzoate synthase [Lysinibacter cavernae]NIH55252.1 O-succinylbenzoate synthase [Lysinibacter cavernae]